MQSCGICGSTVPGGANLCTVCSDALERPPGFCSEQLFSTAIKPTEGALIDCWGRVHSLEEFTPIGRRPTARGIAILDASVSRNHAELSRDAEGSWTLRDVGSSNGTLLDGEQRSGTIRLRVPTRLTFGSVGLYFVPDSKGLRREDVIASTVTLRPEDHSAFGEDALDEPAEPSASTFAGFPKIPIEFFQPSAGGGGLIDMSGKRLQLTAAQFDLMHLLVSRMKSDAGLAIEVRGFSPSVLLISGISWDTPYPTDNHLKQLIRRVRRLLDDADFGNLIESRRGFGYRLRCIPVDAPPS